MADERLRALEREAARGDEPARAALLVERVRLGRLPATRLAAAALLGEPAARAALGSRAPEGSGDLARLVRSLCALEPGARDRVLLAMAELDLCATPVRGAIVFPALPAWRAEVAAAARAALERPSEETRARLAARLAAHRWPLREEAVHDDGSKRLRVWLEVVATCEALARALASLGEDPRAPRAQGATEGAVRLVKACARRVGEPAVREALGSLRAWALEP